MAEYTSAQNSNIQPPVQPQEEIIDIKQVIGRVIANWHLFLISIATCFVLALIYAYYSGPSWHISSKILVEDQKSGSSAAFGGSLTSDLGTLFSGNTNADNEIQILKSRSLAVNVVQKMQLNIRTYFRAGLKKVEIYDQAPFTVNIKYKRDTIELRQYDIKPIDNQTYELINADEDLTLKARFGDTVRFKQYVLVLNRRPDIKLMPKSAYILFIEAPDAAVEGFMQSFNANMSGKQSTAIDLTYTYPQPKKGEAILDKLMQLYLSSNLQNKVRIADSTIHFIDGRIALVGQQLNSVEQQFQQFKQQNDIADISEQSRSLVNSASGYYDKLNQQKVLLTVVNDLEKYLNNPGNKRVIPSSLIVPTDMSFGQAVNAYNNLVLIREQSLLSYTVDNPVVQNYDKQLETSRASLLRNVETYKKSLQVGLEQLSQQNNTFSSRLRTVPAKERNYLDFARQQNLKQELYLYLLQKREETAISKTSTISSSRIIDYSKSELVPFKPKRSVFAMIGIIIGILIPAVYLIIKELLNVRVQVKSDIERATSAPTLGEISHNNEDKSLVVDGSSRSVIAEQFRSLRTNLQYVIDPSKSNVLLFTSSMSGEGKSFLSLNIGSSLAITGKKVVFLELDLRKPKLSQSVGMDNQNGYTNYVISTQFDVSPLVQPMWFNENAHLISSGPTPPNPAELLLNPKLHELIDQLKKTYDYIIIDSAPIGLVTDALILEKFADIMFYVVRQNYTYKSQLQIINDLRQNRKAKNLYLIINDVKSEKGGYYGYGQHYGYGNYIEGDNSKDAPWWKQLIKK